MKLYTIGHKNIGLADFLATLQKHGVTHIIDVRSPADSASWPEYEAARLRMELLEHGIRYADLSGQLSPSDASEAALSALKESDGFRTGYQMLLQAIMDPERLVCLLGCDVRPDRCHRALVIATALERSRHEVFHIEGDEVVPQEEVMARVAQQAYTTADSQTRPYRSA